MTKNWIKQCCAGAVIGSLLFGAFGCSSASSSSDDSSDETVTKAAVIENYANIVYASYFDSLSTAEELQSAIETFVAAPSQATLDAAKEAWLAARVPYGQTEGYRFYDGPIDDDEGPEGALNAWPLDEVYIDYVDGNLNAGIINDVAQTISKETLRSLNEQGSDANVSTGYHAIEFLLWGQDLTQGVGAGERPYTDYVAGGTNSNQDRRAQYLTVVTEILIEDLESMVEAWDPAVEDNYREEFLAMDEDEALTKIFKGIGTLSASELASERINVPLTEQLREFEHSCFSDNTRVDVIENARSIQNVYLGSYTCVDSSVVSGPSLYELGAQTNATLANQLKTEMEESMDAVDAIEDPFESEIAEGNTAGNSRLAACVTALQTQGQTLVELASAMGLTVNTSLD